MRKKILLLICLLNGSVAMAQTSLMTGGSIARSVHLIEITQGTPLSQKTRGLRQGGFETSTGQWVPFDRWYGTNWTDVRVSWLAQVTPHFGLIVGFNTGEKAAKYTLSPGLRLGFILQHEVTRNAWLSFSASTFVGSRLRERSCVADYGAIGGVQEVNCRLAATPLPPADTLKYLVNERPSAQWSLQFQYRFH
jgi:hypothetical protein